MNILTFDIEEWYVYSQYDKGPKEYYLPIIENYLDLILATLEKTDQSATFFCLGKVAKDYPQIIKKIHSNGHEIGCHSNYHKWITTFTEQEFREDTVNAISELENITGEKVLSYRAPAFTITENTKWALEILSNCGITRDASIFPTSRSFGGFPSFKYEEPVIISGEDYQIKEFPLMTTKILGKRIAYSGGGYFRMLPYGWIAKASASSPYTMTYFHIRDLDAKQKKVISPRYFQSYVGIKGAFAKLERYLGDFKFINLAQADEMIDWNSVKKISL